MRAPVPDDAGWSAGRSRDVLARGAAAREPRRLAVRVSVAASAVVHSGDDRRDRRLALPTGSCAAREGRGDVLKRPYEPYFLLTGEPAPARRRAGIHAGRTVSLDAADSARGQPIPGGAEHLERLLKGCEALRRGGVASSALGGAIEGVRGLDQCERGVA
jgi:hypothetical protein